jgi:ribonuclease Z
MGYLAKAYALDVSIRIEDEKLPPEGAAIVVKEFDTDGVVYEENGVRVIAFEVDHGDVIKPAYGYRIEYGGRAVVISGDTRSNENVVRYGADADLRIHEVAIVRPELASEAYIQRIMAHHTTARDAGVIFARTRPKLAAYTHLVFLASERVPPASTDQLLAETREISGRTAPVMHPPISLTARSGASLLPAYVSHTRARMRDPARSIFDEPSVRNA